MKQTALAHCPWARRPAEMQLTPVSQHTLRISLLPVLPQGEVQPLPESIVLAPATWPAPARKLRSITHKEVIHWGSNSLSVLPEPLRLVARTGEKVIQQLEIDSESGAVRFRAGDQPVFGLGEGGPQFDRRGARIP